jgi:hypothetical protein
LSWCRVVPVVGRLARSVPDDVLSACPRLPPENPRLRLTISDKR